MRRSTRLIARIALLATTLLAASVPAQVVAYHNVSSTTHGSRFSTYSRAGYRMLSLSIYGTTSRPLYAAVWIKRTGPSWVGFHGKTASAYASFFSTWSAKGYAPKILTATGSGSSALFAGVMERTSTRSWSRHNISETAFRAECQKAHAADYILVAADVYGTASAPRYVGSWRQNPKKLGWNYAISAAPNYAGHFNAYTSGFARPDFVCTNDSFRYLSVWRDDSVGSVRAFHGLSSAAYQNTYTILRGQGYYPKNVQGSGSGSGVRFAAVFVKRDTPLPRVFRTTGTYVPSMVGFDNYMRALMQREHIRAASLAIVKDCRLVLARSYTWAESNYPLTQPWHTFRIASAAKPLTSIAIHQHIQRRPGAINYSKKMLSFFPSMSVKHSWTKLVNVDHLLTHRGGWDAGASKISPMFRDVAIASTLRKGLPIAKNDIFRYMTSYQSPQFLPGTGMGKYSNYGFMMQGMILERLNPGMTYEQILKRDIFKPLGVTRARIGGSLRSQIPSGEVRYQPKHPVIYPSVHSPSRPYAARAYGTWNQGNLDANGGWVMAAADYAKVLAAFDLGTKNPLLNQTSTNNMWTPISSTSSQLRGWVLQTVTSNGKRLKQRWHNGKLMGTGSFCARREDNVSYVLLINRDVQLSPNPHGADLSKTADAVTAWPKHDLFPSLGIPSLKRFTRGSFVPYGLSCKGAGSAPAHLGTGTPGIGERMNLAVKSARAFASVGMFVGTRTTSVDLAFAGAPGCRLYTPVLLTLVMRTNIFGSASLPIDIPKNSSMVGTRLFTQFACTDNKANLMGLTFTNGLQTTIGGWK